MNAKAADPATTPATHGAADLAEMRERMLALCVLLGWTQAIQERVDTDDVTNGLFNTLCPLAREYVRAAHGL